MEHTFKACTGIYPLLHASRHVPLTPTSSEHCSAEKDCDTNKMLQETSHKVEHLIAFPATFRGVLHWI